MLSTLQILSNLKVHQQCYEKRLSPHTDEQKEVWGGVNWLRAHRWHWGAWDWTRPWLSLWPFPYLHCLVVLVPWQAHQQWRLLALWLFPGSALHYFFSGLLQGMLSYPLGLIPSYNFSPDNVFKEKPMMPLPITFKSCLVAKAELLRACRTFNLWEEKARISLS